MLLNCSWIAPCRTSGRWHVIFIISAVCFSSSFDTFWPEAIYKVAAVPQNIHVRNTQEVIQQQGRGGLVGRSAVNNTDHKKLQSRGREKAKNNLSWRRQKTTTATTTRRINKKNEQNKKTQRGAQPQPKSGLPPVPSIFHSIKKKKKKKRAKKTNTHTHSLEP